MTAPDICEGCPYVKAHNVELSTYEILKLTGTIQLESIMARSRASEEMYDADIEAGYARGDEEDRKERMAQGLKEVGDYYSREFDAYDQGISEEQHKLETLQSGCEGPALKRKYILFGSRVLKCKSKQASVWQRLQA